MVSKMFVFMVSPTTRIIKLFVMHSSVAQLHQQERTRASLVLTSSLHEMQYSDRSMRHSNSWSSSFCRTILKYSSAKTALKSVLTYDKVVNKDHYKDSRNYLLKKGYHFTFQTELFGMCFPVISLKGKSLNILAPL